MAARGRAGLAAAVLGCTALVDAGCAADRAPVTARESTARAISTSAPATGAALRASAARYLVIAEAGNRRLEADLDPLERRDRDSLARAQADLRDAAATERLFDRRLLRIAFPPAIEPVARELWRVNEARATLTTAAAASSSLHQLQGYEPRLKAANRPVEGAVRTIRHDLGLPPPTLS
jgi:hypothetical protein